MAKRRKSHRKVYGCRNLESIIFLKGPCFGVACPHQKTLQAQGHPHGDL